MIAPRPERLLRLPRLTLPLTVAAVLLVLASIAGQAIARGLEPQRFESLIRFFYVDAENNLPTFFSSVLLLISALLVLAIAVLNRRERGPFAIHWLLLSAAFLFMAIDESASMHELLTYPLRSLLGLGGGGLLHYTWVVAGLAGAAVFAVAFLNFFRHLPGRFRVRVALAAGLFLAGALGMEMIGGYYAARYGGTSFIYTLLATIEESLELAGSLLFIDTWLAYLAARFGTVQVCLAGAPSAPPAHQIVD